MSDAQGSVVYTAEQLAAAQLIVDDNRAKMAAAIAVKQAAYLAAVRGLTAKPEWAVVRQALVSIVSENEADGLLSVHITALRDIALRMEATLPQAAEA